MTDEARPPATLRYAALGFAALDVALLGFALRAGAVRSELGEVTTGGNVALSILATIAAVLLGQRVRLPATLRLAAQTFGLAAQAAHALGHLARWYYVFPWYDDVLHVVVVLVAALLAFRVAEALDVFPARDATPVRAAIAVLTTALALAAVWEIFEFSMDVLQGTREQDDLPDTMLDMVDGAIGGVLAAFYALRRPRTGFHA